MWRGLTEARFGLGRLREAESALREVCELAGMPLPAQPLRLLATTGGFVASLLGTRVGLRRSAPPLDPEQRAILTELLAAVGIQEVFVWTDQPELGLLCTLLGLHLEDTLGLLPRRNYHRSALFFILAHTPLCRLCLRYMEHIARRDAARSPTGAVLAPEGAEPHFQAALATFTQLKAAGMAAHIHRARCAPPDEL